MSRFLICCGPQARLRLAQLCQYLPSRPSMPSMPSCGDQYGGPNLAGSTGTNHYAMPQQYAMPQASGRIQAVQQGMQARADDACAMDDGCAMLVDDSHRDAGGQSDSGISHFAGVMLGFDGYCSHRSERGEALRRALIEDFLQHGERCVSHWRGSFRLAIRYQGRCRIYTDQLATRPVFVASDGVGLLYGAHAAPLLQALPRRTIDGANLLQFMQAGRFFAGATLFAELHQLPPGHCDIVPLPISRDPAVASRQVMNERTGMSWYRYRLQPQTCSTDELLPELKHRLDRAILAHWQSARAPALLLSGGYDSRYILNTLAALLPGAALSPLLTCLWGEANPDADADAAWAAHEARRHGLQFEFDLLQADPARYFEQAFRAQSGMTAHVFTHTDDLLRCQHLQQRGYRSLLRGDECFGPDGATPANKQQAMARLGLFATPDTTPWLAQAQPDWREAHARHLATLAAEAGDACDLRDLLYCRERLPSLNAHLNALRAPFLENVNPLLDVDVLDLLRQLPRELRTDKQLFRQCFQRYFPTAGFASSGHAFRWQRLASDRATREFVAGRVARLPAPFDATFLPALPALNAIGEPVFADIDWAAMQTTIRALVLGQWLQDYPVTI